jgi:hypothetical protein
VSVAPVRALATRAQSAATTTVGGGRQASSARLGGPGQATTTTAGTGAQSIQITDLKSAMRANKMLGDELSRPQDFQLTQTMMNAQQLKDQIGTHANAIQQAAEDLMNQALVEPDQLNRANMLNAAKKLMAAVMQMGASAKMAAASGKEVVLVGRENLNFFHCD